VEVSRFFLVAATGIAKAFELQSFTQGCFDVGVLLVIYSKKTIDSWHSSHSTLLRSLACGDEYDWDCETEVALLNS